MAYEGPPLPQMTLLRGSTPYSAFRIIGADLTGYKVVCYVRHVGDEEPVFSINGNVTSTGTTADGVNYSIVKVKFTQKKTLLLKAGRPCELQMRYISSGGYADGTRPIRVNVVDTLKDGEMTYA